MKKAKQERFLFYRENSYYFSIELPPRANQIVMTYDEYDLFPISDEQFGGLAFVKKEGRIGIFTFDSGSDYPLQLLFKANAFPFIFDEVWMPTYNEHREEYIAVRIGSKWGIILVHNDYYHPTFKGWCVPLEYATREDAIDAIRAKYNKSKLNWFNVEKSDERTVSLIKADDTNLTAKQPRKGKTGLRITLSDGTIIQEKQAKDTFIKAIKAAGPAKLLDRRIDSAEPVVSKTRHSNPNYARAQHPIEGGFLVLTQFSTKRKKEFLEKIGRMPGINMNWTVEIV